MEFRGKCESTSHLDPVLVAAIQHVLGVRMLHDQSLSTVSYDVVHTSSDIFGSASFEFGDQLDASCYWDYTGTEVALAEFERLVQERCAVQVEQVEHLDYGARFIQLPQG